MTEQTKIKLDQIEALYPASRIEKSKQRYREVWAKKRPADRAPYNSFSPLFQAYDPCFYPEMHLQRCLDEIIVRAKLEDDYIPSLFPGCRQSTLPNLFGCKEIVMEEDVTCERLAGRIEDMDHPPDFGYRTDSVAQMWLNVQEYWLEETQGRIPIHCVDMQGPMDAAGQMLGYDQLFMAAYDDPERYHRLLCAITGAFVDFWNRQKTLLGDQFLGTHLFAWDWYPPDVGATMSCDSLVMVSPDFYEAFYRPYIERISVAFGGVVVHSCGNFAQVVKNLCQTKGLKGINSSQMSIPELMDAGMTNEIVPIVLCDYRDVPQLVDTSLRYDLHCYITTMGHFPAGAVSCYNTGEGWTEQDYKQLKQSEQLVIAQLKRFSKK